MVKRFFNLKTCLKKRRGEFKKSKIVLIRVHLETGCKLTVVQRFQVALIYPVHLVTRMGDWEIRSVSGRLTPGLSRRVGMYAICESPVHVTCPSMPYMQGHVTNLSD